MASDKQLVDFYELLEVSPNASSFTIERVFRFLAKKFHPDVAETGDSQRFTSIVEAYETLRDPANRAAYDIELAAQKQETRALVNESRSADSDAMERHRLLTLFYAKRKRDMNNPGVGIGTLEQAMDLPESILEFHLWYFREKNWIKREESGLLSITAEGVDKIEERALAGLESSNRKITDKTLALPDHSSPSPAPAAQTATPKYRPITQPVG